MFQNSTNNTFSENNVIDNLGPLTIVGKRTYSRWSFNGKGNYWSSYDGYDLDGDGIGDVPMKIQNAFQFLEGKNANVRLYLYSPATQALAIASKAFPIMDINEETDDHPLVRPIDVHEFVAVAGMSQLNGHTAEGASFTRQISYGITFVGLLLIALFRYHYAQRRR
jgi:nitrous oxidase accessory protein